jgi:hypothetical protein
MLATRSQALIASTRRRGGCTSNLKARSGSRSVPGFDDNLRQAMKEERRCFR